ncbi:MAG TPA: crossover junction endodeoxyribonuclease RuvC, partial [Burkholderiaceae bacterium]
MTDRHSPRRILGIDPGLNRTGFGVIEASSGRLAYVISGVIRVPAGELPQRLEHILRELGRVIRDIRPDEAVVEKVFVNVNPQSTLLLGQARGAAICAAVAAGLAVREYTALQVKQATVGYGKAEKIQVQKMVQRLLGMARAPTSDAADALACAICHAHASSRAGVVPGKGARRSSPGRGARAAWQDLALARTLTPGPSP